MWGFIGIVIVILVVLVFLQPQCPSPQCHCRECRAAKMVVMTSTIKDDKSMLPAFLLAGKMSCKYMDQRKWRPVHSDNRPYVMLDAVNTFHRGDVLMAQAPPQIDTNGVHYYGPWEPVGRVVSVMNINAFPVVVLDRPVFLAGYKIGVAPTPESSAAWTTTLLPDPIKSPVHEMTSMSRYQS